MTSGVDVQVGILGSIEVIDGDCAISLSPQLRRLLGVLIVADGAPVSSDRLAEYVADGNTTGSTVRTAVSRLRKVLGDRIESTDGGYRLTLEADELDAATFERLRNDSRSTESQAQISALSTALDLWRGQAFGDLADEEWALATATKLDTSRADAIEDLASAFVASGCYTDAVEVLEEHVVEHPYRERPVALLMRAFAASGRTADALRSYRRFVTILRDDTGLDPSVDLRALEAELLAASDPTQQADAPTVELPNGTVTFMFTDIEGSTERWQQDEAAMSEALAVHDELLRTVTEAHGGLVFKHTGDGVCAAFASAGGAVDAAVAAQETLALPVRIGLHTGEAELRGADYFGPSLNRTARIMDAGNGGQILMSSATAALITDRAFTDLGEHRLKGLAALERIIQHGTKEFPSLRVTLERKGNLPAELSAFVGRTDEISDLADRLAVDRLVTLFGVGGTGKTRLSIEAANAIAPAYPDGCWIAELSLVAIPEAVPLAIAAGLGIPAPASGDVVDHLVQQLRHRRLLLIVDNCEHVLSAAADVVERITAECPAVTVLATSREPLMVSGEQLVAVPSMSSDDAVRLFIDRARAEAPNLELDDLQTAAISELCARLDYLPLAIELAASRLRAMTPVEILGRLDERFRLLVGGRRSRMERHQTMRGTIDWSYDLCDDTERAVFDRLSVFAAGFDLSGASAVAAGGDVDEFDVVDAVSQLVDRSLLQRVSAPDGTSRFRMLETMRAYGREHLRDQGVADDVRGRHARHMAATVGALTLEAMGPDEDRVHARMRELVPDALVALDWCIDHRDWHHAVRAASVGFVAANRVWMEMTRRLCEAIIDADGTLDAVEPIARLHLALLGGIGEQVPSVEWYILAMETIRNGTPLPTDVILATPYHSVGGSPAGPKMPLETAQMLLASLDAGSTWPTITRFSATHAVHEALTVDGWVDLAVEDRDRLERVLSDLQSPTAQRRNWGLRALQAELDDDRMSAVKLAERAIANIDGTPTTWDVSAACRSLRNRAFAGLDLTGEHVRRPWRWIEEGAVVNQRWHAAFATVLAMDRWDAADTGDRLLAWIKKDFPGAREFYGEYWTSLGLLERFDSLGPSEDDLEALIAEVMVIVDNQELAAKSRL